MAHGVSYSRTDRRRGYVAAVLLDSRSAPKASGRALGAYQIRASASTAILAAAEFIGGSVFWSSAAWTPTALRAAKALSLQETGWIMGVLSVANMLGSFTLGSLSDKFGRKRVIALSALPAAAAAFMVFYWLDSAMGLATGIFVFGLLKASVPALVVALAQETAPPGSAGTAAGAIMSLHYTAGVLSAVARGTAHYRHRRYPRCDDSGFVSAASTLRCVDWRRARAHRQRTGTADAKLIRQIERGYSPRIRSAF